MVFLPWNADPRISTATKLCRSSRSHDATTATDALSSAGSAGTHSPGHGLLPCWGAAPPRDPAGPLPEGVGEDDTPRPVAANWMRRVSRLTVIIDPARAGRVPRKDPRSPVPIRPPGWQLEEESQ